MRRCLSFLALPYLLTAGELPIPIQAPLARVRLHPDEAWITRAGQTKLGVGTHRLQLKDLPPGLVLDDVRVSAQGPEGVRLGDLALDSEVRAIQETATWKAMESEAEGLQDHLDQLNAERASLAQESAFLKALQASHDKELSVRMNYTPPSSQAIVELSKGLQQRLTEVLARDTRAVREIAKLQSTLSKLQAEMTKRQSEQRQGPSRATVEVTLPKAGEIHLEFSYRSRMARWEPNYEARLSADGHRLELALFAAVRQQSGEDWKDVAVEISNVRASRSLDLPRYTQGQSVGWYTYPPQEKSSNYVVNGSNVSQNAYSIVEVVASNSGGFAPPPKPVTFAPEASAVSALETEARKIEENQGLGVTFQLDGRKDIASDGEPNRFKVMSKDIEHQFVVACTPRLDTTAYQVARFPSPKGIPLFPGAPIVQFVGTQRLGQTRLVFPEPGKPFQLAFGPHRPLSVRLYRADLKTETLGLISKDRQWTQEEHIDTANNGAEAVEVEIYDRLLVSTDEKVRIHNLSTTTPPTVVENNVRMWKLHLEPEGKQTLRLDTQIRVPVEGYISGLEGLGLR